jgi:hypothetical protein
MSTAESVIISQLVLAVIGFLFLLEIRKLRKSLDRASGKK